MHGIMGELKDPFIRIHGMDREKDRSASLIMEDSVPDCSKSHPIPVAKSIGIPIKSRGMLMSAKFLEKEAIVNPDDPRRKTSPNGERNQCHIPYFMAAPSASQWHLDGFFSSAGLSNSLCTLGKP